MIKIAVEKCWFNIYKEVVLLELSLTVAGLSPILFNLEVPEDVLALLRITPLFDKSINNSEEFAGDWTGQTWQITLSTTM